MYAQWTDEQEMIYPWVGNPSVSEQENVLDWIKSIGAGAAQGAGTGVAAGPWGALIGGLIGGGLGALQQASQQQSAPQRPASAAPGVSSPTPQPAMPPPGPVPQSATPAPPASGSKDGAGAVQQFTQLLPQLIQLIQAIQPIVASTQQSKGRAKESNDDEGNIESLAGDPVPDNVFMDEQTAEMPEAEDDEHFGLTEVPESTEEPIPTPPRDIHPPDMLTLLATSQPNLNFSGEWANEAESAAIAQPAFQWVG